MMDIQQIKQLIIESKVILGCKHINKDYWRGYIMALEKVIEDKRWCYGMMDLNRKLKCDNCIKEIREKCFKLSFDVGDKK